jgi:hypothetical protein
VKLSGEIPFKPIVRIVDRAGAMIAQRRQSIGSSGILVELKFISVAVPPPPTGLLDNRKGEASRAAFFTWRSQPAGTSLNG